MALNKLAKYIEIFDARNKEKKYGEESVVGLSTQKMMIKTKADLDGVNLSPYKLVPCGYFAYVPDTSRRGDKMSMGYNDTNETVIVSSISCVFRVKPNSELNSDYLFMFFNRPEFDRYARFNSWGSAREAFSWADMCDIDIELPPLPIQQKYVDIYKAMLENQRSYERDLEDLKLVCDGYIEDLRRKYPCQQIGKSLTRYSEKNTNKKITEVVGLSTKKEFRKAQRRVKTDELGGYKILHPYDIAFVPTTDTWKVLAFAVNHFDKDVVVSPIYEVFATNHTVLLPDYLAMWLKRNEFDRYARYNSWGSARENFSFDDMRNVEIPIPTTKIQKSIVELYIVYEERKQINEKLKSQIKDICPILIKGSLEEAR